MPCWTCVKNLHHGENLFPIEQTDREKGWSVVTQKPTSHDNPAFSSDSHSSVFNIANGVIVTTKLQAADEDDEEEKNNVGFEKLPDESHPIGLFVWKIRERLIRVFQRFKVSTGRKECVHSLQVCFSLESYHVWSETCVSACFYRLPWICPEWNIRYSTFSDSWKSVWRQCR